MTNVVAYVDGSSRVLEPVSRLGSTLKAIEPFKALFDELASVCPMSETEIIT
jgi:hypothetical protein